MQTGSSHLRGWWECSPCLCSAGHSGSVLLCSWCESHAHISFLTVLLGLVFLLLVPISYIVRSLVFKFPGAGRFAFLKLVIEKDSGLSWVFCMARICQVPYRVVSVWQEWSRTWEAPLDLLILQISTFYPSWIIVSGVCESFILGLVLAGPALYLWTLFSTQNSLESESWPWVFTSLESEEKCPE